MHRLSIQLLLGHCASLLVITGEPQRLGVSMMDIFD